MRFARTIVAAASIAACTAALAQVERIEVRKQIRYQQTSATDVVPFTAIDAYQFRADVVGNNIGGLTPAPRVMGPFNVGALGARHNDGNLVYDAASGAWRYGRDGGDFTVSSRAELDALFPNGTYSFSVPGVSSSPVSLSGDLYPAAPRIELSGGAWANGAFEVDPSKPLVITTSPFVEWGTRTQHIICVNLRGEGFLDPGDRVISGSECLQQLEFRSQPNTNSANVTIPAGRFLVGREYNLTAAYLTFSAAAGQTSARYVASTTVRLKTGTPVFPMTVTANITPTTATASAQIQFRPQDIGTQGSVFVFALAPQDRVQGAHAPDVMKIGRARDERKAETPIACVLAQLNASGQMVAVSSANLAAYLTGVLSAQGASVSILNGVPTGNVTGATFFVGYGPNSQAMINTGVNRAAVTIPGSLTCAPTAPQTGWWWNPAEDGRGFSIEKNGNNLFFASFLYHASGRSTWLVSSGPVSLEGSLYNGDLLSAGGGQTLGGPYIRFPTLRSEGSMTLTFNNESTGTLVWPGGTVPIQRFNIIPNGLTLPAVPGQPESGWWWNESEAGRGFFLEFQNGWLDIAGYMYDDDGNPVWYLTVGQIGGTAEQRRFDGTWWSYGNGMTLSGPWRPHARTNANVAPLAITFTGADSAVLTLPNQRTTNLRRHRF